MQLQTIIIQKRYQHKHTSHIYLNKHFVFKTFWYIRGI